MPEDKLKQFYEFIPSTKKVDGSFLGDYNTFSDLVADSNNRVKLFKNLAKAGFTENEIGTEQQFHDYFNTIFSSNGKATGPVTKQDFTGSTVHVPDNLKAIPKPNENSKAQLSDEIQKATAYDGQVRKAKDYQDNEYLIKDGKFDADGKPLSLSLLVEDAKGNKKVVSASELKDFEQAPPELVEQTTQEIARLEQEDLKAPKLFQEVPLALGNDTIVLDLMTTHDGKKYFVSEFPTQKEAEQVLTALKEQVKDEFEIFETEGQKLFEDELTQRVFRIKQVDATSSKPSKNLSDLNNQKKELRSQLKSLYLTNNHSEIKKVLNQITEIDEQITDQKLSAELNNVDSEIIDTSNLKQTLNKLKISNALENEAMNTYARYEHPYMGSDKDRPVRKFVLENGTFNEEFTNEFEKNRFQKIEAAKEFIEDKYNKGTETLANNTHRLKQAETFINKIDKMQDAIKKGESVKSFFTGITNVEAEEILSLGINEMFNSFDLLKVANKASQGKELSNEEKLLLSAYGTLQQASSNPDIPISYQVGSGLTAMAPYMAQFIITGGVGTLASKGVQSGVRSLINAEAKQGIKTLIKDKSYKALGKEVLARTTGYAVGAAAQTPLFPQLYSEYGRRRIGAYDGQGNLIPGTRASKTEAAFDAFGQMYAEVASERLGEAVFKPVRNLIFGKVAKEIPVISGKFGTKVMQKIQNAAAWDGVVDEYLEEFVNMYAANFFTGDKPMSEVWDNEEQLVTLLTVVAMGGSMYAAEKGMNAFADYKPKNKVLKKEQLSELDKFISHDKTIPEIAGDVISFIEQNKFNLKQTTEAITYITKSISKLAGNEQLKYSNPELYYESILKDIKARQAVISNEVSAYIEQAKQIGTEEGVNNINKTIIGLNIEYNALQQQWDNLDADRNEALKLVPRQKSSVNNEVKTTDVKKPFNTIPLPENFTGIEIIKEVNDGKQDLVLAIITDNNGNSETITMPKEQAALAQVMINLPEGYRIKQKDGIIYLTDAEGISYTFRNAEAVQSYLNETPVVNKPKSENNVPNNTIKPHATEETLNPKQENISGKPEPIQSNFEQDNRSISELEEQKADIERRRQKELKQNNDIELARSGDEKIIESYNEYGLDYEKTTLRRFVSGGEVESVLRGEKQTGRFKDGKVDVTSQEEVTTAATNEYRITFNDSFDFNNGGKATFKNKDLGDGNLKEGYTIDDVLKIEKINDDGSYSVVYEGKNKTIKDEINAKYDAELAALENQSDNIVEYAKNPDGSLKTKDQYTPEEWQAYTKSVIDQQLSELPKDKQVWELNRIEFIESVISKTQAQGYELNALVNRAAEEHKKAVQQALSEGKQIPDEVLANYPEIKAQVEQSIKNNTNFVNNENDGQRSNNEDAGIQPEGKTGSSRNDEVASILRGDGQTDSGTLRGSQSSQSEQEEGLKKYAEENGILFSKDQVQELSSEQLPSGKEADVYISKSGTSVVKVINYKQYSRTPLDFFINRISVYNTLFEGTAYNIIGFTETDKGLSFIVEQPFIKGKLLSRYDKSPETYQEQDKRIADYLKDKFGMESAGLDAFENDQYLIEDLHHKNVIEGNDGQLYFIDVIPTLKKQTQQTSSPEQIKEQEAATNPNPSDAQKEAGNFKKGHIAIQGLDITIENPKGSERSGIDKKGKAWSQTMNNTYGYFKRSKGKDGDQIDVFIGNNLDSDKVFVVDQVNNRGKFDEHKVMMGFNSIQEAKEAYLSNYKEGWQGLGEITEVNISDFKKWLDNGTRKQKAFADYKGIKKKRIGLVGARFEASKLEVYTPHELAQMYFILGGQVNHIALFKLFGTKGKEEEPIVKARVTSEKRARFPYYSNKKGLSIDEIAHKLWEENEHLPFEDSDYRDAIGEVILSYNSPITMAKDLLKAHGEKGMNQVQNKPIPETIEPTIETEEDIKNNERIDNYNERFADVINEEFYYDNTIFWSNLVALTENDPEYFTIFPHDLSKAEFEEFKKIIKDDTRRRIYEKALGKSGTDEIEQAEGFARGEEDFKEESDESYDADDSRREGYKPDRIPTTSGTEDGAAEKQHRESSEKQLKPLTAEQQYVSDEYNRRISELKDLLKTQRHERTNKLNAIDKRNGLFGDTQKEEGNLFDSEFNTSIDNVNAILQPFNAKISHTENQIEILLKQKQQAIDALLEQTTIDFEQEHNPQFAGELINKKPKEWWTDYPLLTNPKDFSGSEREGQFIKIANVLIPIEKAKQFNSKDELFARMSGENNLNIITEPDNHQTEKAKLNELFEEKQAEKGLNINSSEKEVFDFFNNLKDKTVSIGTGVYKREGKVIDVELLNRDKINNTGVFVYFLENGEKVSEKIKVNFSNSKMFTVVEEKPQTTKAINPERINDHPSTSEPRKTVLSEYNNTPEIINLNAFVDKVRKLDPNNKSDKLDISMGYNYEAKVSYPNSLGEQGNYTSFWYKNKPTVADIEKDLLEFYPDEIKNLRGKELPYGGYAIDAHDENIINELQKALDYNKKPFVQPPVSEDKKEEVQSPEKAEEQKPIEKIEDFGEKIEGAKKMVYQRLAELTEKDLTNQPLSKSFPRPDFVQLVKDGTLSEDGALVLKYLYDNIPPKPRKTYKLKGWVNVVQEAINTFTDIVENKDNATKLANKLRESGYLGNKFKIFEEIQKALGFPAEDINMGAYEIKKFHRGEISDKEGVTYSIVKSPYILSDHKTAQEAAEALKKMLASNKEKSKDVKLNVYQDRKTGKFFIGKKTATGVFRLVDGIETVQEARAKIKNEMPQLQELWNTVSAKPEERRKTNRARVGTDYRKGQDVSPNQFTETFGFRGTQFGNWVKNDERQESLNDAYDALMDLATALKVSPRALSLGGELGMAFGARGSGKYSAHYEPGQVVINLTKTKGAGSLAHEWWHALDNYFSRQKGSKSGYLTDSPGQGIKVVDRKVVPDERLRNELIDAFKGVINAINKSKLGNRSFKLDDIRSKLYWSTMIEMSARSFENFIIEKLGATNEQNDYLANFKETGEWINSGVDINSYPYPLKEESPAINEAFQQLFDTIEEKIEDDGRHVLFQFAENEDGNNKQKVYPENNIAIEANNSYLAEYLQSDEAQEQENSYKTSRGENIPYRSLLDSDSETQPNQIRENRNRSGNSPHLRKLKKGEFSTVERKYTADKNFSFTGNNTIESDADIAFLFRQLETASVENAFAVYIDKNGKAVIQHLSMGTFAGTIMDQKLIIDGVKRFNAEKVYFVHNHPSGNLQPSNVDVSILNKLKSALPSVDVLAVIININSGEYSIFHDSNHSVYERPIDRFNESAKKKYPVLKFDRQVFKDDVKPFSRMKSSQDIAVFISAQRLSAGKKGSLIVLDRNNNIKAKLELGAVAFSSEQADEVASYVIRFGGESAILFGRYGEETIKNRKSDVNTFNNILKAKGITLLDVLDIGSKPFIDVKGYDGFSSMADLGLISEPSIDNNLLFDIADIKPSFKEQLQDYIDGNFPSHKALDINVLKDGVLEKFIAPLPLKMRQRVLKKHQEEYEAEQLFDLEHEINNPVFILQGEHQGSVTVLTEIKDKKGNNILGAIELNVKMQEGIKFYEVNNITSLYGKTSENLLKWIENGKILYAEKEKGLDWLVSQTGSDSPRVLTIQNLIVQKYEEYQRKSSNDLKFLIRPETPQFAAEILSEAYYQKYIAWEKAMKDEINRVANELGLKVISVPSEESLPRIYRRAIKSRGMEGKVTGFFDTESGAIYVIIANNKSTKSVYELLLHEGVAHKGLRLLFGDKYNAFLESIYNQMTAKDIDTIIKRGYNPDDKHEIADEFLAKMAESGKRPTWFDKIIAQIRELIRKIFGLNYSNKDIINLLELSRRALRKQQANNKPKTGHDPQFAGELLDTRFMTNLWHGSPHLFDKFSTKHIGTGEGAQAYGWGLYFTDKKSIAEQYAKSTYGVVKANADLIENTVPYSYQPDVMKFIHRYWNDNREELRTALIEKFGKKNNGEWINKLVNGLKLRNLYKVKIHGDKTIDELNFIRWDKAITEKQKQAILNQLEKEGLKDSYVYKEIKNISDDSYESDGRSIYELISTTEPGRIKLGEKTDKQASEFLLRAGIDGIQYPAEYTSKGSHEDSFNYVVFDENAIEVDEYIKFNLSEQITKTPEFKQWFGDWEKPARIEKLKQSKPLIMSGNEYKGKYELNRASAQRFILDNLRATYTNKDSGDEITLTRKGTNKLTSHDSENTVHLKSIAAIPEMIENAIFITEEKNTKENAPFDAFRYYVVGLKIDNEDYTARITIGKEGNNYYYDHGLTQIEKGELITNIGLLERRLDSDQLTLSDYKDTRLIDLLQDNSSKVVDKNGSPLEVYHGSPEDFNEFDVTKPAIHRKSENIGGIYFSGNINTASNYRGKGGKIKKVYLSIQNPLDITPLIAKYQKKGMKYMEAKLEALKSLDKSLHDGVIFKGNAYNQSEYVVFSSNQIKSATNNNGEFDAKNPDIRFSLGGEHLKRLDDYKKADPEYQEIVDKFKDALKNAGLADKLMGVSKSQTDYGMSWYIKLKDIKGNETYEPFTIRISDHSVTSMNRLGDQKNLAYINYRYVNESDYDKLVNKYKQALDYQKQSNEKRDELTRAADQKRENIKQESQDFLDDILQQGKAIFNSNQRFNSLKEIKEKHPDWEHILWNGNEIKDHNDRVWYVAPDNKYGKKYIPEIYYNYLKKEGLLDKETGLRFKFDEEGEWIEESDNKHTPNQPERTEFAGELLEGISKHMDRRRKLKQTLESLYTASREVLQDRDLLLRHMLEDAWKNGGKKTEGGNPYRDKNLGYGRMENLYTEFKEKLMMPLVKAINKLEKVKGVDLNQIMAYMIAKHAPERNAYIRKQKLEEWLTFHENASEDEVNEMIFELSLKDFSGIGALDLTNEHDKRPDELANRLAAEFEAKVPKELIDEFWQKIKPTTDFAIEQWLASEAISDKQYQEIKKMYKYFVPLRGWHEAAEKYLSYHHRTGGEPSIQKTLGRVSLPDNPIAYIEQVAFKSITERVNNEVNQALLEFVMVNPNKDLYELKEVYYVKVEDGKGENDWVMTTTRPDQAMFKAGKAKKTMYNGHERFRKPSQAKEHEVIVHLNGRDIAIVMKGEMLPIAQIMNHHNNLIRIKGQDVNLDAMNNFLGNTIGVGVNMLKQLYTSLNIVFPYTNYSRDLGEAFSTTVIMADGKQAFDYLSYNPTAFNTIRSYLWGSNFNPEKNANHKLYHEFLMDGGTTGYSHNQTIEERSRELKKQIENSFKGVHFSLTAVKEQIENISRLFEDATRFSIYVSARKNGKSRKDAAAEAKEASVNFNRKGKATKTFDSLFAFFNPAIQSLQKNTHLAKKYPKRFGTVSVAWMMFGFIIAELNRLFDDDEDDDKGYYNINTYVRENYLVLPVFGEESYLRIPLPQFWRGFYSWGVLASDVIHGKKTVAKAVSNGGINFASGLTPVDVGGFVVDGKFSIGPLIPTIYKPVYEIGVNRNFLDQPIYRAIFDETQLQSKLHLNYVNPALKVITDGLLAIAHPKPDSKYMYYKKEDGSIEQVPSMFDINPSKVEHLIRSYGGGTIKAAGDLFGMLYSAVMPTENVVIDNVPIINAFIRKYPEKNYEVDETYYKLKEEAEINKKLYNEAVNPKNMKKDLSDPKNFINQDDLKREFIIKNAEYRIKQLKDQLTDEQIDLDTYYTKAAEIRHKAVSDIKQPKNK